MKTRTQRILSMILSFAMFIGVLNFGDFAMAVDNDGNKLSFVCGNYKQPKIGENIETQFQVVSNDNNTDLTNSEVSAKWLKNTDDVWAETDEVQFDEGEYRLALSAKNVESAYEYEFNTARQPIVVNSQVFEYAEANGLESAWENIDNTISFTVYSKVFKLDGVEYWKDIFTRADASEYAEEMDLETALEYNADPEFAGKTDEERIAVIKSWNQQVAVPMPLADPAPTAGGDDKIYYKVENDVLYLNSTPYNNVNNVYEGTVTGSLAPSGGDQITLLTIKKIVIENKISPKNLENWFNGYSNVTEIENIGNLDTSKTESTLNMFYKCSSLETLDVSGFDTSNVTKMSNMFSECMALTTLDCSTFKTGKVTDMNSMFSNLSRLKSIDITGFDTSKVTTLRNMFKDCSSLEKIDGIGALNVTNVGNIGYMFSNCGSLTELDLSQWEAVALLRADSTFSNCEKLKTLSLGKFTGVDKSNFSQMFSNCSTLEELDLSGFDTSKVSSMSRMFNGCTALKTLNIKNFTISEKTNTYEMFGGMSAISKLTSPKSVQNDSTVLPVRMVEEDNENTVYGVLAKSNKSMVLVPFGAGILSQMSDSTIYITKYIDNELATESFDFAVYKEDGTLVDDTIKTDEWGEFLLETKNYEPGRYYIEEVDQEDGYMYYDKRKFYFEISETVKKVDTNYVGKENVYYIYENNYLDESKYTLISSGFSISVFDKNTGDLVDTIRAYCADKNKNVSIGTLTQPRYSDPSVDELVKARFEKWNNPNLSDEYVRKAIACILYYEDPDDTQSKIWDILNYEIGYGTEAEIDTKYNNIPKDFGWGIITRENDNVQPLIVPLYGKKSKTSAGTINTDEITMRVINIEAGTVSFKNSYDNTFKITIKKVDENGNLLPGAHLKVYDKDGMIVFDNAYYAGNDDTGEYVLNGYKAGEYTLVEEATPSDEYERAEDVTFNILNEDVIITMVDNFSNNAGNDTGNLIITKTLEGDVTADEANGAITFTVTAPGGTSTEYTLADFTKGAYGKYTLTLTDVAVGEYTVEETTHDIAGKTVTVTYTVNGVNETTGDRAITNVTNNGIATVAFRNNYKEDGSVSGGNRPRPNKGNLVITKTIEGEVTAEEAEGAITFKVTAPGGTSTEYTLADFTKDTNGKYTLTLTGVAVGNYKVEEITHDIYGRTVTVTYKINDDYKITGNKPTVEVKNGETSTVAFMNNYEEEGFVSSGNRPRPYDNPSGNGGNSNPTTGKPNNNPSGDHPNDEAPTGAGTDSEELDETPAEETPAEKNPATGNPLIALAVIPVALVAAIVVKKRR